MAATTPQPQMGLTFEQVWAAFMEDREAMRISNEKFDKRHQETEEAMRKTDEQIRKTEEAVRKTEETVNKMCERVDRVTANVGGLNRSMGELIETLIAARLWEKFDGYLYNFRRAYQRLAVFDETDRQLTDIDIALVNGEFVMAVEVKASLHRIDEVDRHLKRMELILKYPPAECKGKKLLGAMVGGAVDPDVQAYAHSVGFFVLELTGESVHLAKTPDGFTPRQW
ncbi:hypothetical protein FACS189461_1320 [Spirochaetia bacterium]|nr:hypothetical protein FACS189461_1320 [Spirochaetia bacterium]